MKRKTTLIIAHRLSTIKNADEILKKGILVEKGTRESLMDSLVVYFNLVMAQFMEVEKNRKI